MRFQHNDGGRATSRRPKQRQDCTVRAIAITALLPYDDVYDALTKAGRKSGHSFRLENVLNKPTPIGHFSWVGCPAVKGERRLTVAGFSERALKGRFIVKCAKHVIAVVDGLVLDDGEPRHDACVYGYWIVED